MRAEPPLGGLASGWTRRITPIVYVLVALTASLALPAHATPRAGQSACNLVPLIAPTSHPLRRHATIRGAVDALTAARDDQKKNLAALARFDKALAPLWRDATRAFARPTPDPRTGEARPFAPAAARAFLTRWVLTPQALLRVGDERFEPVLEISAWMTLAACRGGDLDRAIAIARAPTGAEAGPLRAFAALLLLERGAPAEAHELTPTLGEDDFLEAWVQAELAETPDARARWHELARRRVQTPDQEIAWQSQKTRL